MVIRAVIAGIDEASVEHGKHRFLAKSAKISEGLESPKPHPQPRPHHRGDHTHFVSQPEPPVCAVPSPARCGWHYLEHTPQ